MSSTNITLVYVGNNLLTENLAVHWQMCVMKSLALKLNRKNQYWCFVIRRQDIFSLVQPDTDLRTLHVCVVTSLSFLFSNLADLVTHTKCCYLAMFSCYSLPLNQHFAVVSIKQDFWPLWFEIARFSQIYPLNSPSKNFSTGFYVQSSRCPFRKIGKGTRRIKQFILIWFCIFSCILHYYNTR